jgi:hypothetical protein
MSQDFTQSNKPLEAAIAACQSPQQVAETLRQHKEANGLPSFDNRFCESAPVATPMPAVTHPESDDRLLRRAVIMPDGTTRLLEAYSTSGLDVLQRALETGHI